MEHQIITDNPFEKVRPVQTDPPNPVVDLTREQVRVLYNNLTGEFGELIQMDLEKGLT